MQQPLLEYPEEKSRQLRNPICRRLFQDQSKPELVLHLSAECLTNPRNITSEIERIIHSMFRLLASGLLCASFTFASGIYTDLASWTAAASQSPNSFVESGNLSNPKDYPDLILYTQAGPDGETEGIGRTENGVWIDCVGKTGCGVGYDYDQTFFGRFAGGSFYGFGGNWNIQPSQNGLQLLGVPSPTPFDPKTGGYDGFTGFWGFVTNDPYIVNELYSDSGFVNYTLTNVVLDVSSDPSTGALPFLTPDGPTTTPEPASLALCMIGLIVAGSFRLIRNLYS